jgi:hypothetical protein
VTWKGPNGETAPDAAVVRAIPSPVERARVIGDFARIVGSLPPDLAELRREALIEARTKEGRRVGWLATELRIAATRISRLTKTSAPEGAAA